jgi:2-oxoglutarate ferredoxin oxidoreductase subunit gamma
MTSRVEIRLAGMGGQGMVLAGMILADAAIRDGRNAVQSQGYGPEARGGASRSEVVISDGEIDYPEVIQTDILLCMSQEACDRYYGNLKKSGLLIVDTGYVKRTPTAQVVGCEFTAWALETTGREVTASVLALAFLVGLTDLVSRSSLEAAVAGRTPPGTAETNLQAMARGLAEAEAFRHR